MAIAHSKNNSEIKRLIYSSPNNWTEHKDETTGWTGYRSNGNNTVTVKWKDGSADQVHNIASGGTVLFANGFVHFSA